MMTRNRILHRVLRCSVSLSVVLLAWTTAEAQATRPASTNYFRPQPVQKIPPGTEIDSAAPAGWTHLVLKSQPRLGMGDIASVPEMAVPLTSLLFSAVLANVATEQAGETVLHRLDKVAFGLGTKVQGRSLIISSDSQQQLGLNLGILGRQVLSGSEKNLAEFAEVARSPTMSVVDIPAIMLRDSKHRNTVVRHVVVVHPNTGYLAPLLWVVTKDPQGRYQSAEGPIYWLQPNTLEDRILNVDANEFTLGMPSPSAFAMVRLPPGFPIELTPTLKQVASQNVFTPELTQALESQLWDAMRSAVKKHQVQRATTTGVSQTSEP